MNPALLIIGSVFATLAALLHVVIFYFESIGWTKPAIWKRFGVASQADADTTQPMAYNQGFYNLFLAVGVAVGAVLLATGVVEAGFTLVLWSTLSMVAAATVLVTKNPKLARAAATQGVLPLVAVLFLLLALI